LKIVHRRFLFPAVERRFRRMQMPLEIASTRVNPSEWRRSARVAERSLPSSVPVRRVPSSRERFLPLAFVIPLCCGSRRSEICLPVMQAPKAEAMIPIRPLATQSKQCSPRS
jgi:hypothetical protein